MHKYHHPFVCPSNRLPVRQSLSIQRTRSKQYKQRRLLPCLCLSWLNEINVSMQKFLVAFVLDSYLKCILMMQYQLWFLFIAFTYINPSLYNNPPSFLSFFTSFFLLSFFPIFYIFNLTPPRSSRAEKTKINHLTLRICVYRKNGIRPFIMIRLCKCRNLDKIILKY